MLQRRHAAAGDARPARRRGARAQQQLRRPDGEPLPTGARSFVDEQRVRHASAAVCRSKRLRVLAEPGGIGPKGVSASAGAGADVVLPPVALMRARPWCAARQHGTDLCLDTLERLRCIEQPEARRLGAREPEIARAHLLEEFERLHLEAIGIGSPVLARAGARQSQWHRQVEQQGAVGCELRVHRVRQRLDQRRIDATAAALVGARGVGEAIAYHPLAASSAGG